MSKKEPFTDSSSNLNLNLYELVSIINQMTGKCKGHASICIHLYTSEGGAQIKGSPMEDHVVKSEFFHDLLSFGFFILIL